MTITRLASAAALVAALGPASPAAEMLARKLPPRTVIYAEVDTGRAAKVALDYLRFIDPDQAAGIEFNAKALLGCLKELAAHREFRPEAFDVIGELRGYFVMMAKDEPEVRTRTYRTPKWDYEKGERIEGEFEEHTDTTRKDFTLSFVAEAPTEDVAADFLGQVKALLEREAAPGGAPAWTEVAVDRGEMVSAETLDGTLGRLGTYVVFSDSKPVELWAALMAPAEPSLAESAVYRRLHQEGEDPAAVLLVNLAVLVERLEESLLQGLEEAEAKSGPALEGAEEEGFDEGAFRVQMARTSLEVFFLFEKLLSLDRLDAVGVSSGFVLGGDSATSKATVTLRVREPISPVLGLVLDGGHALEAPAIGEREGVLLMARLGVKEIFTEVMGTIDPKYAATITAASAFLKTQVGHDIGEILAVVAGDVYAHVDFTRKEVLQRRWDPEIEETVTKKVVQPAPEVLFLVGLEDAEALSRILSEVFSRLTAAAGGNPLLGKRTFLGSDVYLLGPGVSAEGAEPDGSGSFAAAVAGRHLAVGSWKDVTGLIRRAGAGADDQVARLVARHPRANLLALIPGSLNKRLSEMLKAEGQDPFEELRRELASLDDLPVEDAELRERLRGAIQRLVEGLLAVAEKAQGSSAGAWVSGARSGEFYEIGAVSEMRK